MVDDAAGESCVCVRSQVRDGRVDERTAIGIRDCDITTANNRTSGATGLWEAAQAQTDASRQPETKSARSETREIDLCRSKSERLSTSR